MEMDNSPDVQDGYLRTSPKVFKGLYLILNDWNRTTVGWRRWGFEGMAGSQRVLSALTDVGHEVLEGLVGWERAFRPIGRQIMVLFGGILMGCRGCGNIWNVRWGRRRLLFDGFTADDSLHDKN